MATLTLGTFGRSRPRGLALLVAGALLLAACDDSDDGDDGGMGAEGIDSLGQDFVGAFNLTEGDQPVDAQSVDLTLTPRIEPFDP